jgi:hypothetical protein
MRTFSIEIFLKRSLVLVTAIGTFGISAAQANESYHFDSLNCTGKLSVPSSSNANGSTARPVKISIKLTAFNKLSKDGRSRPILKVQFGRSHRSSAVVFDKEVVTTPLQVDPISKADVIHSNIDGNGGTFIVSIGERFKDDGTYEFGGTGTYKLKSDAEFDLSCGGTRIIKSPVKFIHIAKEVQD